MKFPRVHPLPRARRNAAAPTIAVTTTGDFIKMRIDQVNQFRRARGSFKTTRAISAQAPYGNGAPPHLRIPRTTNRDIRAVVQAWDQAFRTYGLRDQALGGKHNEAFEETHRRRWERTRQLVDELTAGQPESAQFARNAEFWAVWLDDLAKYLSERQLGRPARLDVIIDVVKDSVVELPGVLTEAGRAAARGAGKQLGATATWVKWGAAAGVGLLVVPAAWSALRPKD